MIYFYVGLGCLAFLAFFIAFWRGACMANAEHDRIMRKAVELNERNELDK